MPLQVSGSCGLLVGSPMGACVLSFSHTREANLGLVDC